MKAEYRIISKDGTATSWTIIDFPVLDFNNLTPDWVFISSFYNGYHKCNDICYSNDLSSYLDGQMSLKRLNEVSGRLVKSRKHAERELNKIDDILMKRALKDFMLMVASGELQFKTL